MESTASSLEVVEEGSKGGEVVDLRNVRKGRVESGCVSRISFYPNRRYVHGVISRKAPVSVDITMCAHSYIPKTVSGFDRI
jgi:hypothetical protein